MIVFFKKFVFKMVFLKRSFFSTRRFVITILKDDPSLTFVNDYPSLKIVNIIVNNIFFFKNDPLLKTIFEKTVPNRYLFSKS